MKHLAWLLCVVGLCMPCCAGPIYRAGQSSSALSSLLHGEISADYQFSSQRMKTLKGDQDTSALQGWNVRALWTPIKWLSVGAEMTRFGDEKLRQAFISSYETSRITGLAKLTLSPNTSPRVYLLAGYGRTSHKLNYDHSVDPIALSKWPAHDKKNTSYWMAGIGVEVDVWSVFFVGAEGNLLRHQKTELARYYRMDTKTERVLRVRVGVRF